jgi:hypothetical protein
MKWLMMKNICGTDLYGTPFYEKACQEKKGLQSARPVTVPWQRVRCHESCSSVSLFDSAFRAKDIFNSTDPGPVPGLLVLRPLRGDLKKTNRLRQSLRYAD